MNIQQIIMRRKLYGKDEGQLTGEIEFDSEQGNVTIKLTPEHVQQVLNVCADAIVELSTEVATELTAQVIEQVNTPQLEEKEHIQ